jgi:hypothetical protein
MALSFCREARFQLLEEEDAGGLMQGIVRGEWLTMAVLLVLPAAAVSQAIQQTGTLVVSGYPGQVPVTQISGRTYVAVDELARLLNGSLGYHGSQVTLALPASPNSAAAVPSAGKPASSGFSKDFLNAGIETMSEIREWRSALLNAVESGSPITEAWMANYRAQATKSLRLTDVAASTDSDRKGLELLGRELEHMKALGNDVLAARQKMNYITPDLVKKNPLDQKIMNCARSLTAMASSGEFQDDGSCN